MIDAYGDKRNRALEPDGRVRRLAEIALAGFAERSWHRCFSAAAFFSAFSLCGPPILTRHTPMFMAGAVWEFAQ
ncbi:hypothetical protein [Neorhizobium sp. DAR64861/K0K2]|jgi:hypothetical protein|uniref:hypothetical protein n=1 Tax=unclassified Neorhizobium TaxID=2629175 RepID=UPI003D26B7CB